MSPNEYQALALRTMADQGTIRERNFHASASTTLTQLDNAARGMAGDVGEVNTCVQKCLEYGKPLDVNNLKEELGDVLWRICQACDAVGLTLEQVMEANIAKLAVRYGDKYSDYKAAEENRNRELDSEAMNCKDSPIAQAKYIKSIVHPLAEQTEIESEKIEVWERNVPKLEQTEPKHFPPSYGTERIDFPPSCGEGFRFLTVEEHIELQDQIWDGSDWQPANSSVVGNKAGWRYRKYRRPMVLVMEQTGHGWGEPIDESDWIKPDPEVMAKAMPILNAMVRQDCFKVAHNIQDCTCAILDFDWPNPTLRFNKSCPVHRATIIANGFFGDGLVRPTDEPEGKHFTREQIRDGNGYKRKCAQCRQPIHDRNPTDVCTSCTASPMPTKRK